jgi:hypothetical protein
MTWFIAVCIFVGAEQIPCARSAAVWASKAECMEVARHELVPGVMRDWKATGIKYWCEVDRE